ncbi:MAG: retroviral-like aspartic protease family protein [Terriglobales bacterium]
MAHVDLPWNPFDHNDPGPCINVIIMNSHDVIEAGRAIGLEYPEPRAMRALLDTGASVTVISKVFANRCKLFQTSEGSEITAIGATHQCWEHAGAVSFPGTDLRPLDPIRIVSAVFAKERSYAILIGRHILRNWSITFNGRSKRVTIED